MQQFRIKTMERLVKDGKIELVGELKVGQLEIKKVANGRTKLIEVIEKTKPKTEIK